MPTVPTVPGVSTGIRPLAAPQQRGVDPDPLGGLAQAGEGVSRQLFGQALDEKRRADETVVLDADTKLSGLSQTLLTDPERGLFARRGKDAIGASDVALAEFDKAAGALETSLTPDQRRVMRQRIAQQRESLLGSAQRHELTERRRYDVETTESAIVQTHRRAMADVHNPAALAQAEADLTQQVARMGQLNGLGETTVTEQRQTQVSLLYREAIGTMLVRDEIDGAEKLFAAAKGKLVGDDLTRVEEALQRGTTKVRGQELFDSAWKESGGNRKRALEIIRERGSGAVEDDATNRADAEYSRQQQGVAAARQARAEAQRVALQTIFTKVEDGAPLTPREVATAKGAGVWGQVQQRLGQVRNGFAPVTDVNVWTGLQQLAPADFAKVDLLALRGNLSDGDYDRLLKQQTAVRQSGNRAVFGVNSMGSPEMQVRRAAQAAGWVPAGSPGDWNEDENRNFYEFQTMVQTSVDQTQESLGRKVTPSEYQGIIREAQKQVLTDPGRFFFSRDRKVLAGSVAGDEAVMDRVMGNLSSLPQAEQVAYRGQVLAIQQAAGASGAVTDEIVARALAMEQIGLIPARMTPEQARAIWARISR